jgi:hypothetical protein
MERRCFACGSQEVVDTGPLTVQGQKAVVRVESARQCTLCGTLEIAVPPVLLVQLYPPGVHYLMKERRARTHGRRRLRRQMGI